jgi:hypothetical protein
MCLLTSDVPVVLLNAPDAEDQLTAAAVSDILLPLDPHRLLFLPGTGMPARDPRKRTDHRLVIPGRVGIALVQVTYDVADAFVTHHPGTIPGVTGSHRALGTPLPGTATAAPHRCTAWNTTSWRPI